MPSRCANHPDNQPCATKAGQDAAAEVMRANSDAEAARIASAAMRFISEKFGGCVKVVDTGKPGRVG